MSIKDVFKSKAVIPFITCGYPTLAVTSKLMVALSEAGADMLLLGIPFSDPTAEMPIIQKTNLVALEEGVTTDKIFNMLEECKGHINCPLVVKAYANVVFSYGIERFVKRAMEVGICGLVIPDIPYEEKEEFDSICKKLNFNYILSVAPTSKERISAICEDATGFIYGVTSPDKSVNSEAFTQEITEMISKTRQCTETPVALQANVSSPEEAVKVVALADGIIIDYAFVDIIENYSENSPEYAGEFVKKIKGLL